MCSDVLHNDVLLITYCINVVIILQGNRVVIYYYILWIQYCTLLYRTNCALYCSELYCTIIYFLLYAVIYYTLSECTVTTVMYLTIQY